MIWILGLAILAALIWLGRRGPKEPNEWRAASGIIGLACIVAGLAAMLRGLTIGGGITILVGIGLALAAKRIPMPWGPMTEAEARRVLGVGEGATPEEIQSAYRARMRTAHPDQGGDPELAARLNTARDKLTKKR